MNEISLYDALTRTYGDNVQEMIDALSDPDTLQTLGVSDTDESVKIVLWELTH